MSAGVVRSGACTKTLAAGSQDNVAPTNWATTSICYVTSDATGSTVTGWTAGVDGEEKTLYNDGTGVLTLKHDQTSTAANRMYLPSGVDLVVPIFGTVRMHYRAGAVNRWLVG
jgi:hypothetical protein